MTRVVKSFAASITPAAAEVLAMQGAQDLADEQGYRLNWQRASHMVTTDPHIGDAEDMPHGYALYVPIWEG